VLVSLSTVTMSGSVHQLDLNLYFPDLDWDSLSLIISHTNEAGGSELGARAHSSLASWLRYACSGASKSQTHKERSPNSLHEVVCFGVLYLLFVQ